MLMALKAAALGQFSVHVNQPSRASALMKIVDILRYEKKLGWPLGIEMRERPVRCIGLHCSKPCSPRVIKCVNEFGISPESLRGRDVFDPVTLPKTVGPAKCRKAAFGRDACAGQHDDVANSHATILVRESR